MAKKLQKSLDFSAFFNNLIDVCDDKNISVTTLIDKFASSRSAMTAWKNGTINADIIPKLALELNVSLDYLLTGEEKSSSLPDDEQELLNYYKKLPEREQVKLISRAETLSEIYAEQVKEPDPIQLIPTYYISNRVSAGFGEYLEDYEQGKTVYVPDSPESRRADFVLTVSGDSMEPKFHDGDNILVRSQPTVEIGQIGIFDVDGEGYIKKLGDGQLISLNKRYPNISLKDRYAKCFGLVLGTTEIVK
ncbi:MAG: helix-turn-helix domain-containing protein [Oscillospiraceae bacterium]